MNGQACAFTGHRPKSFPWKYDETTQDCLRLKKILAAQIKALAERGVTDFLSGMALGTDLWCSRIVLALCKKDSAVKLHCVLPCEGQESKWSASSQKEYHSVLDQADDVIFVSRTYHKDCMLERNRYMVDRAAILLAVYNGTWRSGTGATVRYAQKLGREIFIIHPISREIICINPLVNSPYNNCRL